jgi:two-component system sensor histidine kinase KdpD
VETILNREGVILTSQNGQLETRKSSERFQLDSNELAVAEWSYNHLKPAGHGTDTLTAASMRFIPLLTSHGAVGVLGIKTVSGEGQLANEQRMLMDGLANLIAQAIERVKLVDAAIQSETLKNTEKLQTALLNSISHELRTPLSSITGVLTSLGASENAQKPSRKLDHQTQIELINSATEQARKLNRLVENLLSMTRIEAGGVHLHLAPCDLEDLFGSVIVQINERTKDHPIQLEMSPNLPTVTCDALLIAQVIINLLDNAIKYSPPGSPIVLGVTIRKSAFEVYVKDKGYGLPEEDLEKVFNKFYRSPAHKGLYGTGLGLSICKGIVEAHKGWIKASNNTDQGLTIRFGIPIPEGISNE